MSNHTPEDQMPKPKNKIAVLRHNDLDGVGAAYAIWKHLKDTCDLLFIPVQYGQAPPLAELSNFNPEKIFIVDFSYNLETLLMLESAFGTVVIADHHKTAEKDLDAFNEQKSHPMSIAFFDLEMSGAALTWMMFSEDPESIPEILLYVQDRDLWKFELENSKEINAYIATLEESFEVWDDFYLPEAYTSGKAILAFQKNQIERRLKDVGMWGWSKSDGFNAGDFILGNEVLVPFVNASENISELGEALCLAYPDAPFSVSYCDRADGKRSYSLRSRFGFDVSEVAKAFNGGGHPGAAGFTLDAPDII